MKASGHGLAVDEFVSSGAFNEELLETSYNELQIYQD